MTNEVPDWIERHDRLHELVRSEHALPWIPPDGPQGLYWPTLYEAFWCVLIALFCIGLVLALLVLVKLVRNVCPQCNERSAHRGAGICPECSYDNYVATIAEDCLNCPMCQDCPCAGCMAGGVCDNLACVCGCEELDDLGINPDEEWPY